MHFALLGVYVTALLWPQVPQLQSTSATVSVAGRIVDAESRSPIPGARVMLMPTARMFPPGAAGPLQAVTDADGQFVFEAVAPGRYRIDAQKTGFAPLAGAEAPRMLDVAAGQVMTRLDLALTKGGAITGRIVDAGGEPVSETTVTALRQTAGPSGQVMARTLGMAQTNDLGEFRLAGLPEGNYVVIAAPRPQPPFAQSTAAAGSMALAPTYYPGTTSKDAAHIISLASAQTVNGIEFSLLSMRAYQVSGVAVDETGSPLGGAMITLRADPRNGSRGAPAMGRSDQNGTFRIGGVVSGTYRVMAGMPTMWSAREGSTAASGGVASGITGGVVFGANVGGPAVTPPALALTTPIEVTIDNADVTDLKVVVTTRK
jgi:hypothetical protein